MHVFIRIILDNKNFYEEIFIPSLDYIYGIVENKGIKYISEGEGFASFEQCSTLLKYERTIYVKKDEEYFTIYRITFDVKFKDGQRYDTLRDEDDTDFYIMYHYLDNGSTIPVLVKGDPSSMRTMSEALLEELGYMPYDILYTEGNDIYELVFSRRNS